MKEELLTPAIVTLAVALIAGVVSLVVSILTKDQRTSEFRQAWIEGLRDDVSRLIGHYDTLGYLLEIYKKRSIDENEKHVLDQKKDWVELAALIARIRLRLNPEKHQALLSILAADVERSREAFLAHAEEISKSTQKILQAEWKRVKRGEPSFVWLKRISRLLSFIALMAALYGVVALIGGMFSTEQLPEEHQPTDSSPHAPS